MATATRRDDGLDNRAIDEFADGRKYYFYKTRDFDSAIFVKETNGHVERAGSSRPHVDWTEFDRINVEGDFDHQGNLGLARRQEFHKVVFFADIFQPRADAFLTAAAAWTDAEQKKGVATMFHNIGVALTTAETLAGNYVDWFNTGNEFDRQGPQTTASFPAGTYINLNAGAKITNGRLVDRLQINSSVAVTVTLKLVQRTALDTFDVIRSQAITHSGVAGWEDVDADLPFLVPATGDFYMGYHLAATTTMDTRTTGTNRAFAATEATGAGFTITEEAGDVPVTGVRLVRQLPLIDDFGITDIDNKYRRLMDDV